jgi:hypothetical protein
MSEETRTTVLKTYGTGQLEETTESDRVKHCEKYLDFLHNEREIGLLADTLPEGITDIGNIDPNQYCTIELMQRFAGYLTNLQFLKKKGEEEKTHKPNSVVSILSGVKCTLHRKFPSQPLWGTCTVKDTPAWFASITKEVQEDLCRTCIKNGTPVTSKVPPMEEESTDNCITAMLHINNVAYVQHAAVVNANRTFIGRYLLFIYT